MVSKLPTFLVIGAQKCGTSWLYAMLRQHPQIAVSKPKEVHFFNKADNYRRGLAWYSRHFAIAPAVRAVGDFTPNYLWTTGDPEEIRESERTADVPKLVREALPEAKLIVSLRDPVARAVSAYYHFIRAGRISPREGILDVAGRFGIASMGYYDLHLRRWLRHFSRDRFLILIYEEDLADEAKGRTLARAFDHIGVDRSFMPERLLGQHNVQGSFFEMRIARLPWPVRGALRRVIPDRVKGMKVWDIPVAEEALEVLRAGFEADRASLEELLGRELPWR